MWVVDERHCPCEKCSIPSTTNMCIIMIVLEKFYTYTKLHMLVLEYLSICIAQNVGNLSDNLFCCPKQCSPIKIGQQHNHNMSLTLSFYADFKVRSSNFYFFLDSSSLCLFIHCLLLLHGVALKMVHIIKHSSLQRISAFSVGCKRGGGIYI